ncbi:hypothetical protein TD95_003377 [Thielaviopsis punctulata]|uniref:Uncharacterized protein n=1 Tax=Thielaviopsis punctulata TaxID=72032 RepID=A0A0F4ZKY5_9PEZI|nr:hypothetical protein TD95_003377 [Thielaviopsis punctulata]
MQSSRFQSITAKLNPSSLRTHFRNRSSSASTTHSVSSISSTASSPVETINSVMFRQPSIVNMEAERRVFGSELGVLEPRPIVYWGGLEERMEQPRAQPFPF